MSENNNLVRQLPAIDVLCQWPEIKPYIDQLGQKQVVSVLREVVSQVRTWMLDETSLASTLYNREFLLKRILASLDTKSYQYKKVFNLTGILIHSNLGRAVLPTCAIDALVTAATWPIDLEYDIIAQKRSYRERIANVWLKQLCDVEMAVLVNNNASAVWLVLASIAKGRRVLVARGESVEIGGGFRIPDIIDQSGCELVEVGTTNRTYLKDFQQNIDENSIILKIFPSNFAIEGFTHCVGVKELAQLAAQHNIPLVVDLGSGAIEALNQLPEPSIGQILKQGADIVLSSGDKLLGGVQAGIILGKKKWLEQINQHPLKRALRLDKLRLAALNAIWAQYAAANFKTLPSIHLITQEIEDVKQKASYFKPLFLEWLAEWVDIELIRCHSEVGSGSAPRHRLPSYGLLLRAKNNDSSLLLAAKQQLMDVSIPILGRFYQGGLLLDFRSLLHDHQLEQLIKQQLMSVQR